MLSTTFHRRWALIAIVASAITFIRTHGEASTGGSRQVDARGAAHNHHWREAQSCGVACGYMLARLLGSEITYDDAVAAIPIEKGGSSLLGLQEGLAALGVSATVLRAKPRDLDHFATPLIATSCPVAKPTMPSGTSCSCCRLMTVQCATSNRTMPLRSKRCLAVNSSAVGVVI